jgi:hypothetical protein
MVRRRAPHVEQDDEVTYVGHDAQQQYVPDPSQLVDGVGALRPVCGGGIEGDDRLQALGIVQAEGEHVHHEDRQRPPVQDLVEGREAEGRPRVAMKQQRNHDQEHSYGREADQVVDPVHP